MGDWWADDFAQTYKDDATQEEALAAGERLLACPDFPHQEQLRKNLTYWLPKLPGTNHGITIPVEEGWSCFNPSIVRTSGESGISLRLRAKTPPPDEISCLS